MDNAVVQELQQEFPEQFAKDGTPCWSTLPKGWQHLCREVMQKVKEHGVQLKWAQLKEKFGGLRMYEDLADGTSPNDLYDWIHEAEQKSWHVCQECGSGGAGTKQRVIHNWRLTLCNHCAKLRAAH